MRMDILNNINNLSVMVGTRDDLAVQIFTSDKKRNLIRTVTV